MRGGGAPSSPFPASYSFSYFLGLQTHTALHFAHTLHVSSTFPLTRGVGVLDAGRLLGAGRSHPCFGSSVTLGGLLGLSEPQFP